jgi:hypothetical protein
MTKRSTARPTKQKRRKSAATREPTPEEEDIFEVRDILDEKLVKGKLLYKVDWADNPTTGERYDPTWVMLLPLSQAHHATCTPLTTC